ncbi:hypothetical protein GUITHDRAFT_161484 [Guillardia theta CCMP2712]|uniref:Uncharacterized protein n=1 Tax=Guillardia theta (strain CCMP2712) TaxID=905079 RepID=L1JV60_GUITC|nr:hypothetical protein GUITHDRAFT_161484 [Guillardia theta CCMP2712]EKX51978.1 hypothetical protein GUITHDRAFT_161484 [Guillardia theta CCMP2712]|eukprot:XP_005838958.1 hypothetical protein GUITHDRAFT_161484 [Guillardia theta CCMP2712]
MVALTNLATFCCAKGVLDFSFDFSMSIVAVGTVFPLVFCVQASFTRRERALSCLGSFKGTMSVFEWTRNGRFALFLMFKTWDRDEEAKFVGEVEDLMLKLLDDITCYLKSSTRNPEAGHVIYDGFSALAQKMKEFLPRTGYSKPGEGGLSRMQMYLRDLMTHFEGVRAVRDSETPIGLRLFCFALIHISPILLAPYWNHFCEKQNNSEMPSQYGCESGYFVGIFYVLIVLTLYRVQVELENPFDGSGDDDIKWDLWRAQLENMGSYGSDGPRKRAVRTEMLYQAPAGG